jgi:hypothetical protein
VGAIYGGSQGDMMMRGSKGRRWIFEARKKMARSQLEDWMGQKMKGTRHDGSSSSLEVQAWLHAG